MCSYLFAIVDVHLYPFRMKDAVLKSVLVLDNGSNSLLTLKQSLKDSYAVAPSSIADVTYVYIHEESICTLTI